MIYEIVLNYYLGFLTNKNAFLATKFQNKIQFKYVILSLNVLGLGTVIASKSRAIVMKERDST